MNWKLGKHRDCIKRNTICKLFWEFTKLKINTLKILSTIIKNNNIINPNIYHCTLLYITLNRKLKIIKLVTSQHLSTICRYNNKLCLENHFLHRILFKTIVKVKVIAHYNFDHIISNHINILQIIYNMIKNN